MKVNVGENNMCKMTWWHEIASYVLAIYLRAPCHIHDLLYSSSSRPKEQELSSDPPGHLYYVVQYISLAAIVIIFPGTRL